MSIFDPSRAAFSASFSSTMAHRRVSVTVSPRRWAWRTVAVPPHGSDLSTESLGFKGPDLNRHPNVAPDSILTVQTRKPRRRANSVNQCPGLAIVDILARARENHICIKDRILYPNASHNFRACEAIDDLHPFDTGLSR